MPTATIFPGQGSQTPDMAERAAAARPDLVALVAEAAGENPFPRVGESTRFAQPAIFCAALAMWDGEPGAAVAGHSLGELTAFVAAGAISEADGARLTALRGRLMTAAPAGGMLAVLGANVDDVADAAAAHGLSVANDNAPGQVVLSGRRPALHEVAGALSARTVELPVAGAFHSPLMADAVAPFAAALAATPVRAPRIPVYSCLTAASVEDPEEIRAVLAEGLTAPVRWRETVLAMQAAGIERFVEPGPGRVLTGLVKRITREVARV